MYVYNASCVLQLKCEVADGSPGRAGAGEARRSLDAEVALAPPATSVPAPAPPEHNFTRGNLLHTYLIRQSHDN